MSIFTSRYNSIYLKTNNTIRWGNNVHLHEIKSLVIVKLNCPIKNAMRRVDNFNPFFLERFLNENN